MTQPTIDKQGASATPDKAKQPSVSKSLTYIEAHDTPDGLQRIYKVCIGSRDYLEADFSKFDQLLFSDIDNGPRSDTPLADMLLGLETIMRRIEEAKTKRTDLQPSDVPSQDKGHSEAQS